MKKLLLGICLCGSITTYSLAQSPSISWQKALGGSNNESGYAVRPTADGGYVVAGSAASNDGDVTGQHGLGDFWVAKLDASGSLNWQKTIGGTNEDGASAVEEITGGGYIVAGVSSSSDGDFSGANQHGGGGDYGVAKLDATGAVVWAKTFGGAGYDYPSAVHQTPDGGFVVAGYSDSQAGDVTNPKGGADFWLVKLTSNGTIAWQKSYGGTIGDYANHFAIAADGGYILVGSSESNDGDVTGNHGFFDFWVLKVDTAGTKVWQKSFGGGFFDLAYSVANTSDNGYVVTGYTNSSGGDVTGNHGTDDFWVVKLSSTGTLEWQKALGGTNSDKANTIWQTADGGYFVAGTSNSNDGDVSGTHGNADDLWVAKIDSVGGLTWQKALGTTQVDGSHAACPGQTDGYLIAGFVNANDGDVTGYHGGADLWVVKLGNAVGLQEESGANAIMDLFPNPAGSELHVRVQPQWVGARFAVIDMMGRKLDGGILRQASTTISLEQLPAGCYTLQLRGKRVESTRIVKQ